MAAPQLPNTLNLRIVDTYDTARGVPIAAIIGLENTKPEVTQYMERKTFQCVVEEQADGTFDATLPFKAENAVQLAVGKPSPRFKYTLLGTPTWIEAYDPDTWEPVTVVTEGAAAYVPVRAPARPLYFKYQYFAASVSQTASGLYDPTAEYASTLDANTFTFTLPATMTLSNEDTVAVTLNPLYESEVLINRPGKYQKHFIHIRTGTVLGKNLDVHSVPYVAAQARPKLVIEEAPILLRNGILKLNLKDILVVDGLQSSYTDFVTSNGGILIKINDQIITEVELSSYSTRFGYLQLKRLKLNPADEITISYKTTDSLWVQLPDNINPLFINSATADRTELNRNLIDGNLEIHMRNQEVFYRYTNSSAELHGIVDWNYATWPNRLDHLFATVHLPRSTPSVIDLREESTGVLDKYADDTDWRSHASSGFWGGEAVPSAVLIIKLTETLSDTVNADSDNYKAYFKTFLTPLIAAGSYVIILSHTEEVIYYHEDIFSNEA